MRSMDKKGGLPLLLKETKVSLPLQKVTVEATKIKKRDILLLEWAIMAPLASLDSLPPALDEIAREFGIEPIDFLRIVAEQLKVMGLIWETGFDNYQLTDIGRKFFAEGKVVSDPREIWSHMYYHEKTKEWIYGFFKEVNIPCNDTDVDWLAQRNEIYIPGIPEKIVIDHFQKRNELEKNESLSKYGITEEIPCQIELNAKFLLKSDGIAIIPVGQPFGEENKQRISAALNKEALVPLKIKQCLNDLYTILDNFQSIERWQPHEIADSILFTSASEDKLIEYLIDKKPRYMISNRNDKKSLIILAKEGNRLLFSKNPYSNGKTDNCIIKNAINFQTYGLLTEYAYLTDVLAVKVVRVICDDIEIPLFQVEEHQIQDKEIKTILECVRDAPLDGNEEELKRDLALFYIEPNLKSFDHVLRSLYSKNQNKDSFKYNSNELLKEIASLRTLISELPTGKIEQDIINDILKSLTWKNLLEIDPSILEKYPSCYINAVNTAITGVSVDGGLHQLLEDHSNVFNRLDKYINGHVDEIEQLRYLYIDTVAKSFDKSGKNLSKKDIELGIDLLLNISDEKSKNNLSKTLLSTLISTNLSREIKIPLLLKLSNMNINPEASYVKEIGKEMFTDMDFDIYDPGLFTKVQEIITTCKRLNDSSDIQKYLDLPELTLDPKKPSDITNMVENLFKLNGSINSLDLEKISEVLQKVSNQLCKSGDPEKLSLWVDLLVLIRSHEKEKARQFIPVTDLEMISALSSLNTEKINKMKKKLQSLNVYSDLNKSRGNTPQMNDKTRSDSSLGGIIIDGSNVAYADQDGKKSSAEQITQAYDDLVSQGYEPVSIIVGAGLRHSMKKEKYENMEKYFQNIGEKNQKTVFQQAPAGHDDDDFIIKMAIENDSRILTNDLYRDFIEKDPKMKSEIESRLVKYMFNPEKHNLVTTDNPKKKDEKKVKS